MSGAAEASELEDNQEPALARVFTELHNHLDLKADLEHRFVEAETQTEGTNANGHNHSERSAP